MSRAPQLTLDGETLAGVFPFHLVVGRDLTIRQAGVSLQKICPGVRPGVAFSEEFTVRAPRVELSFDDLAGIQHLLLVLEHSETELTIRGQIVPAGKDALAFLGSPWLVESQSLKEAGLQIGDFALHDPVVDLLQVIQASKMALEESKGLSDKLRAKQKELRRARDIAEAANHAKSQFLANMSHELRTPLNAILGFSQILSDRHYGPLTDRQERYIANIRTSGTHLLQLINDVLDLSKVESGSFEVKVQEISLRSMFAEVMTIAKSLALKKQIEVNLFLAPKEDRLLGDAKRLKQVIFNLLSNAIKFTEAKGTVHLEVRSRLDGEGPVDDDDYIFLSISDNGLGIPIAKCEHVFDEFTQVDSSLTRQETGTGLGLALVRQFTKLHGGFVWAESSGEPGKGSQFHALLPLRGPAWTPDERRVDCELLVAAADAERAEGLCERLGAVGVRCESVSEFPATFHAVLRYSPGALLFLGAQAGPMEVLRLQQLRSALGDSALLAYAAPLSVTEEQDDLEDTVDAILDSASDDALAEATQQLLPNRAEAETDQ